MKMRDGNIPHGGVVELTTTATFKIQRIEEDGDMLHISPYQWQNKTFHCPKERGKELCAGMAIRTWLDGYNITHWEKVFGDKRIPIPKTP
jgi:hypothetical protein